MTEREFSRETSFESRRKRVPLRDNPVVQKVGLVLAIVGGIIGVASYYEARIEAREGISESIGTITATLTSIKGSQTRVESRVTTIDNRLRAVENQTTDINTRLAAVEEELSDGVRRLTTLESSVAYVRGMLGATPSGNR